MYYVAVCPHYRDDGGGGKPVNGFVGQSATGPTHGMYTPPLYNPVTGASENRLLLAASGWIGTLLML